jgi:hypothetical protein
MKPNQLLVKVVLGATLGASLVCLTDNAEAQSNLQKSTAAQDLIAASSKPWPQNPRERMVRLNLSAKILRSAIAPNKLAAVYAKQGTQTNNEVTDFVLDLRSFSSTAESFLKQAADLLTNANLNTWVFSLSHSAAITNPENKAELISYVFRSTNGPVGQVQKLFADGSGLIEIAVFYDSGKLKFYERLIDQKMLNFKEDGTFDFYSIGKLSEHSLEFDKFGKLRVIHRSGK